MAKLLKLVQSLPDENLLVLKYLLAFLNRVSRLSDINKMNLQNLGTVFGPNLLRFVEICQNSVPTRKLISALLH